MSSAVMIVADDRVAEEWEALFAQAPRLGVGVLVLGHRGDRFIEAEGGRCKVHDEALGRLPELEACLLSADAVAELVPQPQEVAPEPPTSPPPPVDAGVPVCVSLLGGFRATRGGELITDPCKGRAKEVIAYLAARPQGVVKSELLEVFFGANEHAHDDAGDTGNMPIGLSSTTDPGDNRLSKAGLPPEEPYAE